MTANTKAHAGGAAGGGSIVAPKSAEAAPADLAGMLALLQDMSSKLDRQSAELDTLRGRLAETDAKVPQLVPMQQAPVVNNPNGIMARLGKNSQVEGQLREMPRDQQGRPLGDQTFSLRPPTYRVGDRVRINPAYDRGFPKGITWQDRLDLFKADGFGEITQVLHLRNDGQWLYTGRFPGVQGPSGLDVVDRELLPA